MTVNPAASSSQAAGESLASVVFVCTGNICRSVTAERVLQAHLESIGAEAVVDSAGISDEEEGNPIDPRQARVLAAAGYRTDGHLARRITRQWLAERDLAVAMTARHHRSLDGLIGTLPAEVRPELVMLREFDPEAGAFEQGVLAPDVVDPWYGGLTDFEETLATMERSVPGITDRLRALAGRSR